MIEPSSAAPQKEPRVTDALIRLYNAAQEDNVPVKVNSWDLAAVLNHLAELPPPSDAAPVALLRKVEPAVRMTIAHYRSRGMETAVDGWTDVLEEIKAVIAHPDDAPRPENASQGSTVPSGERLGQVEDVEWEQSFNLYHDAIQRGTKLWQEATGRTETLPDTAKLVAWLLDLVHHAEKEGK